MERISMGTTITRRAKWKYPPAQPIPRIIHLPRRPRRKPPKASPSKLPGSHKERKGVMLERLFDQERSFTRGTVPVMPMSSRESDDERRRRGVVEKDNRENSGGVAFVEEERWKFQAEMLRAECNLLRMERKIAVKKTERRRVHMERTLKYAAQILLSGRKNICEGKDVNMVLLEEQINGLVENIEKMQKRSLVKDLEVKKCSNFDKRVSSLQKQLEKFRLKGTSDEELCLKEIRDMAEASLSVKICSEGDDHNRNEKMPQEASVCSGHCKAIVHRIVEQIRAETEQWSQMQDMLGMVRDEMDELHASRDFWEDRAFDSDYQIQSLQSAVKEWRQRALSSEVKANEVQTQIYVLRQEVERLMKERDRKVVRAQIASPIYQETNTETEKRVLACRLMEDDPSPKDLVRDRRRKSQTCTAGLLPIRRSPLREIGNISTLKKKQQQQQQQQQPLEQGEGTLPLFSLHKEEMKRSL
ncbi:Myosin-related isoform 2 [Hibiscus syriacus]|uniref:Myosin-related isoform 2 n=1 Tax=Hibiscus syriacus TaxID=106335 RepID=A0A6A2YUA3_HIBSY|nr:Myosin-related isoform 2 [Hibiscus syriacus]